MLEGELDSLQHFEFYSFDFFKSLIWLPSGVVLSSSRHVNSDLQQLNWTFVFLYSVSLIGLLISRVFHVYCVLSVLRNLFSEVHDVILLLEVALGCASIWAKLLLFRWSYLTEYCKI
jgi:hypothetical protein